MVCFVAGCLLIINLYLYGLLNCNLCHNFYSFPNFITLFYFKEFSVQAEYLFSKEIDIFEGA